MEHLILVMYIGVEGIRQEDIETFVKKLSEKLTPSIEGEFIVIPTQSPNTRIECINPKYITDVDLINEHTEKMKELQENLQYQLEQIKNNN